MDCSSRTHQATADWRDVCAAARNIISGNGNGMELYDNSDNSVVEGTATADHAIPPARVLGNSGCTGRCPRLDNLVFRGISNSTIGGTARTRGNVDLVRYGNYGIDSFVIGSGNIAIQGNLIGTDATGHSSPWHGTTSLVGSGVVIAGRVGCDDRTARPPGPAT